MAFALALAVLMPAVNAAAESLENLLPYVVENHDRTRAAKARVIAARNRAREALGDWFPTLSQTADLGTENQNKPYTTPNTSTGFGEYDLKLTQMLWDFGATNAAVEQARLDVQEAKLNLIAERQSLILDAITAYANVRRAHEVLKFAKQSEQNIRQQTGLEEAMVGIGSGFSTDVLQAKTQLAGAQARRSQSEGQLTTALNAYRAIFGTVPADLDGMEPVPFPATDLPRTLQQALDVSLDTNPELKIAQVKIAKGRQSVRKARGEKFYPKLQAVGSRKFKNNVSGTLGHQEETLAEVEMTWDINLGMTAVNTLRAAKGDLSASEFTAADTRRTTEQKVRDAWDKLQTAKRSAAFLQNQARIAAAFLRLARKERQLGRRSLIDVLSGETNLINAQSDAASARADVIIAAYGVLKATGQLNYDILKRSRGTPAPIPDVPPPSAKPAGDQPTGGGLPHGGSPKAPVTPAPLPNPASRTTPKSGNAGHKASLTPAGGPQVATARSGPSPLPPDPTVSATPVASHAGNPETLKSLVSYYLAARAQNERDIAEGTAPAPAEPLPTPDRLQVTEASLAEAGAKAFVSLPSSAKATVAAAADVPAGHGSTTTKPTVDNAAAAVAAASSPTETAPRTAMAMKAGPAPAGAAALANFVTAAGGNQTTGGDEQAALPPATSPRTAEGHAVSDVGHVASNTKPTQSGGFLGNLVSTFEKAATRYKAAHQPSPESQRAGDETATPEPAAEAGTTGNDEQAALPPARPAETALTADNKRSESSATKQAGSPFGGLLSTLQKAAAAYKADHAKKASSERAEFGGTQAAPLPPVPATPQAAIPSDNPISSLFRLIKGVGDPGAPTVKVAETKAEPDVRHMPPEKPAFAPDPGPTTADNLPSDNPFSALMRTLTHAAKAYDEAHDVGETAHAPDVRHMPAAKPAWAPKPATPATAAKPMSSDPVSALFSAIGNLLNSPSAPAHAHSAAAAPAGHSENGAQGTTQHSASADPLTALFRDHLHVAYRPLKFPDREIN